MAALVYMVLFLAMAGRSRATWCVCKEGISDSALQKSLDYACGAGADCNPIHLNGQCYNPNTVKAHCSYAVNSYFQKKGQAQGSCDFAGTASISTSDPSASGCAYPSSISSAAGTGTTPVSTTPSTTTPSTTTPSTTTPSTTSPYTGTPSTGVYGGINSGVGPSGAGINTDISHGGFMLQNTFMFSFFITLWFSGLMMLLWG